MASNALQECEDLIVDILKLIEDLLIGADGRPLLQALHFGGVSKLSRRVSHFLRHKSIHRDKYGGENCCKFLRARYSKENRHLLRSFYDSSNDVIEWITERIVESNLNIALTELLADPKVVNSHYDVEACMRQKNCVKDLLEGTRLLDEQDLEGLSIYLLDHKRFSSRPSSSNSDATDGSNKENGDQLSEKQVSKPPAVGNDESQDAQGASSLPDDLEKLTEALECTEIDAPKRHRRSSSDSAMLAQKVPSQEARKMSLVNEETSVSLPTEEAALLPSKDAPPPRVWKLPRPEDEDQSLYDYILSGKFTQNQTPLDRDNAHIYLAETVIFAPRKPRESAGKKKKPEKKELLQLPPDSPIKIRSAEYTLLSILRLMDDPHEMLASDAIQLLKNLEPSALYEEFYGEAVDNILIWSPPKEELVMTIHPKSHHRTSHFEEWQNNLCNSCGNYVDPKFASTLKFCFYYGRFCCSSCHSNKTHVLPARIVYKWDFKEYKVSNFAISTLTKLADEPTIAITRLQPSITKKTPILKQAIILREQSKLVAKYLSQCRIIQEQHSSADSFEDLMKIEAPSVFSLNELCSIKLGIYNKRLKSQLDLAIEHVTSCLICKAQGHLCENCRSEDVVFPFQFSKVKHCQACYACYHKKCFKLPCSKCIRRKKQREVDNHL